MPRVVQEIKGKRRISLACGERKYRGMQFSSDYCLTYVDHGIGCRKNGNRRDILRWHRDLLTQGCRDFKLLRQEMINGEPRHVEEKILQCA